MKSMLLWSGCAGIAGFFVLLAVFRMATEPNPVDRGIWVGLSVMGAIPAAAIGAIFAGVNVIQKEMYETRRELKHWKSIQQMEGELDKPSTHIKPAPPSGRG